MSYLEREYEIKIIDYVGSRKSTHINTFLPVRSSNYDKTAKKIDIMSAVRYKVLFKRARNYKSALRWGQKQGTVISCQKVDVSYHMSKIEYLNVVTKPIPIDVDMQEFVVGEGLEVSVVNEEKTRVEVVDRPNDL